MVINPFSQLCISCLLLPIRVLHFCPFPQGDLNGLEANVTLFLSNGHIQNKYFPQNAEALCQSLYSQFLQILFHKCAKWGTTETIQYSSEQVSEMSVQTIEEPNIVASQVDQILSHLKKKYAPYMSVRAIKYGPCFPFLAKRTHSEGKVEKDYNAKKQLLVDEQLTNIKTIINEYVRLNQLIPAKGVKIQEPEGLQAATAEAKAQYHLVSQYCKNNHLRVDKRERNHSEPKYKQKTRKEKQTPKYYPYSLKSEKKSFYFMGQDHYHCIESRLLRYRDIRTGYLKSIDDPNCLSRLRISWKRPWRALLNNIHMLSKYTQQDIFARTLIINNLKAYHQLPPKQSAAKQHEEGFMDNKKPFFMGGTEE